MKKFLKEVLGKSMMWLPLSFIATEAGVPFWTTMFLCLAFVWGIDVVLWANREE